MINIGQYIELAINWLTNNFSGLFDAVSFVIGGFINGFPYLLFG
ncbi:MAG: glycine/betaine ABC transporter, partial [Bacteroidaceae bacterium]